MALFVNFVAIQYKFQLISWYIVVKTPVRRKEKSCSFFFESKTFVYRGKIRHQGFSESNNIFENSLLYK
ncbi:hypothetical protein D3H55_07345 [Bacillus salacetis]|uniref:Uncharacterized protein n=1 Tax=Bacillus salacetis TaxID=2315464 RepID=A0A3A1R1N7_9BACI|nr:hypothetical protein D3H55_07345 [Bacillus salacetis]